MESLNKLVLSISSNPWVILLSIVFGAIGVIGVIFTIMGLRLMKPRYLIKSNNLIENFATKLTKLNILYNDEKISNLTVSKFVFWNEGKETIHDTDIASSDPFVISVMDGVKILEGKIIFERNKANKFEVEILEEGKKLAIDFEYVDKNEGVIIQIVHTGKGSKGIKVDGTIKGIGRICKYKKGGNPNSNPLISFWHESRSIMIAMACIFISVYVVNVGVNIKGGMLSDIKLVDITKFIVFFISLIVVRVALKPRLPKEFQNFEDIL